MSDFIGVFLSCLGEIGRDGELVSPTYTGTIAGAKQSGNYFFGISPLVLFMKRVAKLKWCFFCFFALVVLFSQAVRLFLFGAH